MRSVSIKVTVKTDSGMKLSEAVISGYETEYERQVLRLRLKYQ